MCVCDAWYIQCPASLDKHTTLKLSGYIVWSREAVKWLKQSVFSETIESNHQSSLWLWNNIRQTTCTVTFSILCSADFMPVQD